MRHKRKLVVSDAGPLIQLAVSDHLYILPKLYDVVIPEEVFEETQYYRDLPDALEIAKATRTWLEVKTVRNRSEVTHLVRQKLGKGEAEAIVLCKEVKADGLPNQRQIRSTKSRNSWHKGNEHSCCCQRSL